MKTQMFKWVIAFFCLFFYLTVFAQNNTKNTPLKGVWTFSLPDAPYGYQDGTIEFKEVEKNMTGVVKTNNSTYNIKEIKKDKNKYTCFLYVDGNDVNVNFIPEVEKITGTIKAEGWEMPITLVPAGK